MLHFQLENTVTLHKHEVINLYERFHYNHKLSRANRQHDLYVSTFVLMLFGLLLSAILVSSIQHILLESLAGIWMSGYKYILYLNLIGIVLLGFKVLHNSIVFTYLTHDILIQFESDRDIAYVEQHLHDNWGIDLNV